MAEGEKKQQPLPDAEEREKDVFGTPRGISPPEYGLTASGEPAARKFGDTGPSLGKTLAGGAAQMSSYLNPINLVRGVAAGAGENVARWSRGEEPMGLSEWGGVMREAPADPELIGPDENPWMSGMTSGQKVARGIERGEGMGGAMASFAGGLESVTPDPVLESTLLPEDVSAEEFRQMLATEQAASPYMSSGALGTAVDVGLASGPAAGRGVRSVVRRMKPDLTRTVARPSARALKGGAQKQLTAGQVLSKKAPKPTKQPGKLGKAIAEIAERKPAEVPLQQVTLPGLMAEGGARAGSAAARGVLRAGLGKTSPELARTARAVPGAVAASEGGVLGPASQAMQGSPQEAIAEAGIAAEEAQFRGVPAQTTEQELEKEFFTVEEVSDEELERDFFGGE